MNILSVIIPVYNSEKYLEECLDSIINQTYKNLEIICVNDGSTDNSLEILNKYAQKDNRINIYNIENQGAAFARNYGIKKSTGKYITFPDSDDYLDINAYETALENIEKSDLACFGIKVFGDANWVNRAADDDYYKIRYCGIQKITDNKLLNTDVSVCNKIFKKDIVEKYNIDFPNGFYYEDAEFFMKYIKCCSTAFYIDKYFYHYRRTGQSTMSETFAGSNKAIDHLYITKHIFDFYQQNQFLLTNKKIFIKIFMNYFNFAYWHSPINQRPKVLYVASEYAEEFDKILKTKDNFIKNMKKKRYNNIYEPNLKFYQKFFVIKKYFALLNRCNDEIIYFLGIRIKRKNKNTEMLVRLNHLEDMIETLQKEISNKGG